MEYKVFSNQLRIGVKLNTKSFKITQNLIEYFTIKNTFLQKLQVQCGKFNNGLELNELQ